MNLETLNITEYTLIYFLIACCGFKLLVLQEQKIFVDTCEFIWIHILDYDTGKSVEDVRLEYEDLLDRKCGCDIPYILSTLEMQNRVTSEKEDRTIDGKAVGIFHYKKTGQPIQIPDELLPVRIPH